MNYDKHNPKEFPSIEHFLFALELAKIQLILEISETDIILLHKNRCYINMPHIQDCPNHWLAENMVKCRS